LALETEALGHWKVFRDTEHRAQEKTIVVITNITTSLAAALYRMLMI
jgi:hypothetical protein